MTVIAVPEALSIICPSWCDVTQAEHVADPPAADGMVVHWAREVKIGDRAVASLQLINYPDGTPRDGEHVTVWVDEVDRGNGLSLTDAESFAAGIVELIKAARG